MPIQFNLYGDEVEIKVTSKPVNKEKRNWENAFQNWSNKEFQDGRYGFGACGYGCMCDYCTDNSYGRPCIRALNEMCREKNIIIDYDNRNFEDIWGGVFA